MVQQESSIGDVGSNVEDEVDWITDDTILTPTGGAVGGETELIIPCVGELVTSSIELYLTRSGVDTGLDQSADDYTVSAATKTITLAVALQASDIVYIDKYAVYGLPGGDLLTNRFGFSYVIFVDTQGALLTEVLSGIVWRELVAKHDSLVNAGLQDMDYGFRDMSPWSEFIAPQGERTELTVNGSCEWTAYVRQQFGRTLDTEIYDIDGEEVLLEMQNDLVMYDQTT
jgi:hypothetical protein